MTDAKGSVNVERPKQVGARVQRLEDPRLLAGKGSYVDDKQPQGLLHVAFRRSDQPHARIAGMDLAEAKGVEGVIGVFRLEDLKGIARPGLATSKMKGYTPTPIWPLAKDKVRYVGEAVVAVVAENRYVAEDAVELIGLDLDPLPGVNDPEAALAPDVAMLLDECPADPRARDAVANAVARTLLWAREQRELHAARGGLSGSGQAQFAIVQGGVFADLREACASALVDLKFDGYAVGGVSVGEGYDAMMLGIEHSARHLPAGQVRYLMGVGTPRDLVEAVGRGMDLFDCVYPTRTGRFGSALTWDGVLHLKNAAFSADPRPIEPGCACDACATGVPRGAIRAGLKAEELLPLSLLSHHNLHFLQQLMRALRAAVAEGGFEALRARVLAAYPAPIIADPDLAEPATP